MRFKTTRLINSTLVDVEVLPFETTVEAVTIVAQRGPVQKEPLPRRADTSDQPRNASLGATLHI